jgi:1,4-alpha-glucan branching enzyme
MTKTYPKTKKGACKVTFELPKQVEAQTVQIVGDFNGWDPNATPMKRKRDGSFSAAITLDAGREYRFRYFLDNERWENDWNADRYEVNEFGTEDSVVSL